MTAIDERARHQLYDALQQTLGPEDAGTMMNLLPSSDWANVATQTQVQSGFAALRAEVAAGQAATDAEFATVRTEIAAGQAATDAKFALAREATKAELATVDARFDAVDARFDAVDARFDAVDRRFDAIDRRFDAMHDDNHAQFATKAELHQALAQQTRTIVFSMIGAFTAYTGLILAAIRAHG